MSAVLIAQLAQCKNHQLFIISFHNIERALTSKKTVNVLIKLSQEYHEFAFLFSQDEFNKLSLHCAYDHIISLISEKEPLKGPLYNMFWDELLILQK